MKKEVPRKLKLIFVNTITLIRLIGALLLPFIYHKYGASIVSLSIIIIFLTDAIDGFLARKLNVSTFFGSMLDGLSDKLLNVISFVILGLEYDIMLTPLILEISNGINNTNNIYIVSFLLGFSTISVWFQISSVSNSSKLNIKKFVLFRIIHGLVSSAILFIFLNIFNITISTSNRIYNDVIVKKYHKIEMFISLLIMAVVLLSNIFKKNKGGNLINDIV